MILWVDDLCWAQLYGSAGLTHVFAVGCQSNSMWRTPESRRERDSQHLSMNCSSPNGANNLLKITELYTTEGKATRGKMSRRNWGRNLPQAFLEHFSLHPQFLIPGFFIGFYGRFFFVFLCALLGDFPPRHLFPPMFTVILLNLFLTPALILRNISSLFPPPLLPSPLGPPPCCCSLCYLLSKRPCIALKGNSGAYLWCICMKGRKEKLDRKEPVLPTSHTPGNP